MIHVETAPACLIADLRRSNPRRGARAFPDRRRRARWSATAGARAATTRDGEADFPAPRTREGRHAGLVDTFDWG